ncbi:ComF family protein [Streptomyces sp. NPDC000983]|uniref:ComF family protein n=1 Tax=Streptomyces sp. NPDC000983 TaxID=3154373 RepID=UPI003325EB08
MRVGVRDWWRDISDLVLPAECAGCGRPRTVLCPACRRALGGMASGGAAPCRVRPEPEPAGLPVVHAAARYGDAVRAVLLAHKERGALALAAPLGAALAGAVRAGTGGAVRAGGERGGGYGGGDALRECGGGGGGYGGGCDGAACDEVGGGLALRARGRGECRAVDQPGGRVRPVLLVPVPSARRAVRARGHDPARRIALAAAAELRRAGTPARVLAVLRQRRAVADQSGLNSRQRLDNLAGALVVAPGGGRLLGDGPVVLVDDLMTTGASLAEAARAVREGVALGWADGSRARRPERLGEERRAVCFAATREDRGERSTEATGETVRRHGVPGMAGSIRPGGVLCAAVVAATPDAFEINRN